MKDVALWLRVRPRWAKNGESRLRAAMACGGRAHVGQVQIHTAETQEKITLSACARVEQDGERSLRDSVRALCTEEFAELLR